MQQMSGKEQYSRLCMLQMTHIKNIFGAEDVVTFAKRNRQFMFSKRERDHSQAEIMSAGKERSYELWCKLQNDEIQAKTDYASSALAATNSLFNGADSRKRKNSYYLCSRCGKPKKGHICKAAMTNSAISSSNPSGNGLNGPRQDDDEDDDDDEEEYKVDPDDPEYEDEDVPEDDDEYP